MTVELTLTTRDGAVVATHQGAPLGAPTPLADLPLDHDGFQPVSG